MKFLHKVQNLFSMMRSKNVKQEISRCHHSAWLMPFLKKTSYYTLITIVSIILAECVGFIAKKLDTDLFGPQFVGYYLKGYYRAVNVFTVPEKLHDSIALVDLNIEYQSIDSIPYVLDAVNACNPKAIGLDVYYISKADSTKERNLRAAIERCGNKIVLVGDARGPIKPFRIHNDWSSDSIQMFYSNPSQFRFDEKVDNKKMDRFPIKLYCVYGGCPQNPDWYVNYHNITNFRIYPAERRYKKEDFENRIVLLGGFSGENDVHPVDFKLKLDKKNDGQNKGYVHEMDGAFFHAFALDNLLKEKQLYEWNWYWNYVGIFIYVLLYVFLSVELSSVKKKNSRFIFRLLRVFTRPLCVILAEMVVIMLCYLITYNTHIIMPMVLCMAAVAFVKMSKEIVDELKTF